LPISSAGDPWNITSAAQLAGARSEVDDVIRGPNRFLVVLDDDDGVAEIAQARQRRQSLRIVALMQADRRLVQT
jgi:hypothetical protein